MPSDGLDTGFPWPVAPPGQSPAPAMAPLDDGKPHVWAQKGFQFHDLLDIVNPLQHLPVISSIYRWLTGDSIGNLPRVVGDALYGGPMGFVSGLVGVLVKEESGKDIGEHVIATLTGGDDHSAAATTEAAAPADPSTPATTAAQPTAPATSGSTADSTTASAASASAAAAPASTAPAAAAATAQTPAAPVVPDHPPMPLRRAGAAAAGTLAATPASGSAATAADTFRKEYAQRELPLQQRTAVDGRVLNVRPVPLDLPAGALSSAPPAPKVIRVMAPTASSAGSSAGAAASSAGNDASTPAPGQPIEISQKMLNALDKYMALQKAQAAGDAARGVQVDVSP